MASIIGHCALGFTLGKLLLPEPRYWPYWLLAAAAAFLPDADVIGFKFHVAYGSLWGHRGLSHSLLAAAVVATAAVLVVRGRAGAPAPGRLWALVFLATVSHGLLDALTNGGLGVAFFSPFDAERYFFAFRPLAVSPIGVKNFVGEWAARVVRSEARWILLPCGLLLLGQWARRRAFGRA
ncbi:metal-dependent hydrolase [Hymenobacter rubripertinctus]|uniref:Metal-dependent hydrolase n=1 Tax=Hymenobacter rubripertinctus TaxID=2029981 RepID=A0A418QX63_9BACT|nr:metal-dependent hydrolase [Hymenobacter rubripertinctus]RIY09766.1 metal-dependent hydrolase [Hymenobacter rubripertinctus]